MKRGLLCCLFCIPLLSGISTPPLISLQTWRWLLGSWELNQGGNVIIENWREHSATEFYGNSYRIKGKDSIPLESIRLWISGDSLFYCPLVVGQNDGREVCFSATQLLPSKLVFENPLHDFPQTITYTRLGKDSLRAEISGLYKGEMRRESFAMRRLLR